MTTSRAPHKLTLDILESAFLGSEFFPLRMTRRDGDVIDATKDGVIYATVRIVGNAIIVEPAGTDKAAGARATRVSRMLKAQKAAAESQPYSADAEWARRMDPERRGPYTIQHRIKGGSAGRGRGGATKVALDWSMYAGGTSAKDGTHSYDTKGWFGEFHIWPPQLRASGERRRTRGYALMWANAQGLPITHTHRGLWHDVGVHKTPAIAKKAARDYIREHLLPFAPSGNRDGTAGEILAAHLTRQQLQARLAGEDVRQLVIIDESDGIEACQVDTGEVPDWKHCECYRCALKSETHREGPRTYTVEHGGEVFESGLKADEVEEFIAELDGDASVIDEATGTVVVRATDGHPVTPDALELRLMEYEADPEGWGRRP